MMCYERVKRLAGNEIERGIWIPTIESRASNISIDKGSCIRDYLNPRHRGSSDEIIVEHVGANMGIQIRCWLLAGERLGHVCMVPEPVGSTHLRFDDARVIGNRCTWLPNVVRSPG